MPKEFVSATSFYDYKTPITETLDKVRKFGAVVVLRGRKYYGIVDDRSLFRKRGGLKPLSFSKKFPVGKLATKLPLLDSETSLGRLIGYFHDFSAKALPYQEGKRITGIVKREVVVSMIVSMHMLSKSKVAEIMSSPLVTVGSQANMAQVMEAMEKNNIARVVVVNGGSGLAGLISQRDITDRFTKPEERLPEKKSYVFSPANVSVASIMRTSVYTIDAGRPAEEAAKKMLENKVSSLVVMRGARPIGIVAIRDIIERAAASTARTQSRIIVSGLDEHTRDYEQDVRDAANRLVSKIDRFEGSDVDYISINVERHRERNYEVHARLALRGRGAVFAHATGYNLDSTLSELLSSIYKRVRARKEGFVNEKRLETRRYEE